MGLFATETFFTLVWVAESVDIASVGVYTTLGTKGLVDGIVIKFLFDCRVYHLFYLKFVHKDSKSKMSFNRFLASLK